MLAEADKDGDVGRQEFEKLMRSPVLAKPNLQNRCSMSASSAQQTGGSTANASSAEDDHGPGSPGHNLMSGECRAHRRS